jgi:Xaa-Pro dipeptidase
MIDFEQRLKKARGLMAEKNMNAMVLSRRDNFYYMTGILQMPGSAVIVPIDRDPVILGLWVDHDNIVHQSWIKDVRRYVYPKISFSEMVRNVLDEMGLASAIIGIEKVWRGYGIALENFERLLKALPNSQFVDANEILKELRTIKAEEEIALLRRSAQISSKGMEAAVEALREGKTELEVAAEAEWAMKKEGAERIAFQTMIGSGGRTTWTHPFASEKKLQKGDLVVIDLGAVYKGYNSELSRTTVIGEATQKQKQLIERAVEVQKFIVNNLKFGMRAKEIDEIAEAKTKEVRAEKLQFVAFGIGLDSFEAPDFSRDKTIGLEGNMIFTAINCQIRIKEMGVAKISDTVWMSPEGKPVFLTEIPSLLF